MISKVAVDITKFNPNAVFPYELRREDFQMAMQDVYDFFFEVNARLTEKGLARLGDMLRPAIMSGLLSDMLTVSLAKHSRVLNQNRYFNGHPDLVVQGVYVADAVKAGTQGVEIKTTRKVGGAVDTHGARNQWMCVFVYEVDSETGTRSRSPPYGLCAGVPSQGDRRRLSQESSRRVRNPNGDAPQGWDKETSRELDLQTMMAPGMKPAWVSPRTPS